MTALLYPYCTLKEVQDECANDRIEDEESFRIAINNASRWIDWHCGRDFLFHDHAASPLVVPDHWIAENTIFLPWPVITLTAISVADAGESTALEADEYRSETSFLTATGKITRAGRWKKQDAYSPGLLQPRAFPLQRLISLTGTFGYVRPSTTVDATTTYHTDRPSASIPQDIRQACIIAAAVRSGKSRKEIFTPDGNRQTVTAKNIPKDTLEVLSRYKMKIV